MIFRYVTSKKSRTNDKIMKIERKIRNAIVYLQNHENDVLPNKKSCKMQLNDVN